MRKQKSPPLPSFVLVICITGLIAIFNGADWLRTAVFSGSCVLGIAIGDRMVTAKSQKED